MINRAVNAVSAHYHESEDGVLYEFTDHAIDDTPSETSCIYAFCTEGLMGFRPVFIGKAEDLSARLSNHERRGDVRKLGATKLLVCQPDCAGAEDHLDAAEAILIRELQPPLNTQSRGRFFKHQGAEVSARV